MVHMKYFEIIFRSPSIASNLLWLKMMQDKITGSCICYATVYVDNQVTQGSLHCSEYIYNCNFTSFHFMYITL